ncbi:MAG: hypothetical protein ACLTDI_13485 [Acutalibacteraceae bacterium]
MYPNVAKLDYDNKRTREGRVVEAAANAGQSPPIVLMEELYQLQNNQPMTEQQADFAVKPMEEIWEEADEAHRTDNIRIWTICR